METGIGVKGVVIKENKVLLLIKPDGRLDLPGGRVEGGETLEEALTRETMEETGLSVFIREPIYEWSFNKTTDQLITGATYLCCHVVGKIRLSPEHSTFYWAPFDDFNYPDLKRWFDPMKQVANAPAQFPEMEIVAMEI